MTPTEVPDGKAEEAAARALVRASQREALLATGLFIGLLGGGGILTALAVTYHPIGDPAMNVAMGLFWIGLGLITLVHMAAFGPKPHQVARRDAVMSAGQIVLGAAQLTELESVKMTMLVIASVIMFLAIATRPRRFFGITPRSSAVTRL